MCGQQPPLSNISRSGPDSSSHLPNAAEKLVVKIVSGVLQDI